MDFPPFPQLLLATSNPNKIREIRQVLESAPVLLVTTEELDPSIGRFAPPVETGRTFAENALLKARRYAAATGLPTVAEDSGLVIDALGGRPGVESARYPGATYPEKFRNLYRELGPHTRPWTARFVCSLTFVRSAPGASVVSRPDFACEAAVEGEIAAEPRGGHGFGYDPIFYYPPYGCTLGEVSDERKLAIAHRGKAFRAFREWLGDQVVMRSFF